MIELTVFSTLRMMDPIVLCYGKGQLTGFLVDPNRVLDVVSDTKFLDCLIESIIWNVKGKQTIHKPHRLVIVTHLLS